MKAVLAAFITLTAAPALARDLTPAERGGLLFSSVGCYQCHGAVAQGSSATGPALAPNPMGVAAFRKEVRTPRAVMPAYSPAILPDAQLEQIYAYLKSIPVGRSPDKIPLLAGPAASAPSGDPVHGQAVYAANCAGCHGAALEGGSATALHGEGTKHGARFVAELIKAPPAGMPRLYPATLSEDDVQAVTAYIRQTK